MTGIEYGLGGFGDGRLQKGGPACMLRWLRDRARACAGLAVDGLARCGSGAFCTTVR